MPVPQGPLLFYVYFPMYIPWSLGNRHWGTYGGELLQGLHLEVGGGAERGTVPCQTGEGFLLQFVNGIQPWPQQRKIRRDIPTPPTTETANAKKKAARQSDTIANRDRQRKEEGNASS